TVTIVANFQQGQDLLDFGNGSGMGNITGEYDADAGILALTSPGGTATLAEWETALRAVTYSNPSLDPDTETRTIGFTVHDRTTASNAATRAIAIVATNTAPVNSIPGSQTLDQNETLVFDTANDNALSVFDVDVGSGTIRVNLAE